VSSVVSRSEATVIFQQLISGSPPARAAVARCPVGGRVRIAPQRGAITRPSRSSRVRRSECDLDLDQPEFCPTLVVVQVRSKLGGRESDVRKRDRLPQAVRPTLTAKPRDRRPFCRPTAVASSPAPLPSRFLLSTCAVVDLDPLPEAATLPPVPRDPFCGTRFLASQIQRIPFGPLLAKEGAALVERVPSLLTHLPTPQPGAKLEPGKGSVS
jgi:hypothetical protein